MLLVYKIINVDSYVLLFDLLLLFWRFIVLVVLLVKNFFDQVLAASDTNTFFSFEIIHFFILEVILFYGVLILLMLFINVLELIFIFIIYHEILLLLIIYIIFTFLKIVLMKFAIILNNLLHLMFLTKIIIASYLKLNLLLEMLRLINFKRLIAFRLILNMLFSFLLFDPLSFIWNHFISILFHILFRAFFFIIFFHDYFNCFFWRPNFSKFSIFIHLRFIFIVLNFPHILIIVDTWVWNIFLYFFCKI